VSGATWLSRAVAVARLITGGLFLYAVSTKLGDMHGFAEELANYRLLPAALVPAAAVWVIGLEIVAGALLLLGRFAWRPAALVITALLAVFTAGIAQALLRGIDLRCGCFGAPELASWWTVLRDVAMLAGAALVLWRGPGRLSLGRRPGGG
jgi:uncharacterized membrane protein YphA (DoxX/SURF4 family)